MTLNAEADRVPAPSLSLARLSTLTPRGQALRHCLIGGTLNPTNPACFTLSTTGQSYDLNAPSGGLASACSAWASGGPTEGL